MNNTRLVKISKYLSKHLRHQPERLGLSLAPGGWVEVDLLLASCRKSHFPITRAELDEVVVIQIDAKGMLESGYLFYVSANGVWLVDHVPTEFLTVVC